MTKITPADISRDLIRTWVAEYGIEGAVAQLHFATGGNKGEIRLWLRRTRPWVR